jgi:hypothetical protein
MGQTDNNEDDVTEVGGGGQETETFPLQDAAKWESSEEEKRREKEATVIKARIVQSVSLGRDDDDGLEGACVKQETEDWIPIRRRGCWHR